MMILDAIENAANEHAVWFLVTAYLESLHQFHASLGIPAPVVALPLEGMADLRSRLHALGAHRDASSGPVTARGEVSAVLETAVERLDAHLARENR